MPKVISGWKPDVLDERDFKFSVSRSKQIPVPETGDLRSLMPPVWQQLTIGSCVSHGVCAVLQYVRAVNGLEQKYPLDPSRLFNYYFGRLLEGTIDQDSGLTIRTGIKAAVKYGIPKAALWPYDITKFKEPPTNEARVAAFQHVVFEYRRVILNASSFLQALAAGHPIIIGSTIYESFQSDEVERTGIVPMPNKREWMVGGHCMVIVGWNTTTRKFLVRNSWGTDWGLEGHCWVPYDYFTTNFTHSAWIITKAT
jgi:Papain family cysteine protease